MNACLLHTFVVKITHVRLRLYNMLIVNNVYKATYAIRKQALLQHLMVGQLRLRQCVRAVKTLCKSCILRRCLQYILVTTQLYITE